jgi:2-methylcitrate dehydratase PrpD
MGFAADEVAKVRVLAPVSHLNNLMYREPADPAQAKFSLEHALATILRHGRCGLADFEPAAVMDRATRELYRLVEREGIAAEDIAEVRVSAPASHLANLMHEDPRNPAQAKFSLDFALATIALRGRCALADFEDDAVLAPEVRAFFGKVRRVPVDKSEGEFPTQVEVTLGDGTVHRIDVEMPVGSLAAPLSQRQYATKFDECAARFITAGELADLEGELGKLAELPSIAPVMDRLARPWMQHG